MNILVKNFKVICPVVFVRGILLYSVKIIITTFNSRTRRVFGGRGFVDKV